MRKISSKPFIVATLMGWKCGTTAFRDEYVIENFGDEIEMVGLRSVDKDEKSLGWSFIRIIVRSFIIS